MKHIADIQPGGFIVDNEYHKAIGEMLQERDAAILALAGDKAIISGVEADGATTTAGVVTFNGKIYRFVAGETAANVITKRIAIDRPNASQIDAPAFYEDVIEFGDTPDTGFETFPFADFTRVKTLQDLAVDENLVNVVPTWESITGKPAFLGVKVLGRLIIGELGTGNTVTVSGDLTSATVVEDNNDDQRFRVNFASLGTTNYFPQVQVLSKATQFTHDNEIITTVRNLTATSFDILTRELVLTTQNIEILVQIIV